MPTEPTSELVLQNIVSTLRSVDAGGTYWTTIRNAFVGDDAAVAEHDTPAAYVIPYTTDMDGEGRSLTDAIRHEMRVEVRLVLTSRDANGSTHFERYIADVIRALYVDRTRGGNAVHTIVEDVERSYQGREGDAFIATLSVRVPFRTTTTDLGQSF